MVVERGAGEAQGGEPRRKIRLPDALCQPESLPLSLSEALAKVAAHEIDLASLVFGAKPAKDGLEKPPSQDFDLSPVHHLLQEIEKGGLVGLDPLKKRARIMQGGMDRLVLPEKLDGGAVGPVE
jgi:hypothetical protein